MADGVILNANTTTGATLLTDDTGATGHAQVVKLAISTDGSPTLIPATDTDGLLVNLGANNDVTVTGAVSVDDGGGSITVDGAVAATQSGTWTVQPGNTPNTTPWLASIHDGTTKATVRDLAANDALNVAIVDGSGNQVTSFGGGTQYTEDVASASDPIGTMLIARRSDSLASEVSANRDNIALNATDKGELYIKHVDNITVAGTVSVDDGGGTVSIDDGGDSITVDNNGTFAVQVNSALPAGSNVIGHTITDSGSTTAVTQATGTNLHMVVDSGTVSTITNVVHIDDNLSSLTVDDGGSSLTVDNGGTFAVQESGSALTALQLIDNASVDHDATAVAGVIQQGLAARTSDITAVSNGDAARAISDTLGKQVVLIGAVNDLNVSGTHNYTDNAAADVIATAGAGVKIAVMAVVVTNAHVSVGTKVSIRDGTTVKITGFAAANGGGWSENGGGHPLFITTANTAVTAICATTGADVDVNVSGYKLSN